ncbi:MAG: type II toxin-antitoxin system prevent-host-death family antitoxin [Actinobacteria bacterium]|nr:type II toxin-antitoxin system prevent-host-death family antitoxin [Actinomycetota bacterium]MSW78562.1 type II toxin-antitoxin system prevent-host-death family antitoxin [Actinomycetota bacterium]MSX55869.1 type II toxin-antitoxin system prevent-host-death family antitoxin [Actinomycetota bacterium]MSX94209.1 type II toxin-antitoxin system prevent-host-death family antitoxin [Actinomycetota bacterium]MSZ83835.1 type II toxin-antitoxin system prevent-host-death family antitoxin [Actinomyceto
MRDLRNHGGEVVDRVEHGESVVITRAGTPVAELRPLPRRGLEAAALLERWRRVPTVDAALLFHDLDAILDFPL